MFEYRLNLTVEVTQTGNAIALQTPVPIQLHYSGGHWNAECDSPFVSTVPHNKLEEAITDGARAVANELQANVQHQPVIIGRITPDDVPAGRF